MNFQFIRSILQEATYVKKEGTITSYLWHSGMKNLPKTLTISKEELSKIARKGRNLLHPVAGQMLGCFTKNEESPLKQNAPYKIRTQIWSNIPFLLDMEVLVLAIMKVKLQKNQI